MNRSMAVIEIGLLSGLLGIIAEYLGAVKLIYIILLIIIAIDTFTGIAVAIKSARFSARGVAKFIKKFLTYSISIVTVRLLEISMQNLFDTTVLSQIMAIFLVINETISVLENLAIMGVPLPSNFISYLLGHIRIPGIQELVKNSPGSRDENYNDVEDIIKYQISTFASDCTKRMLEINIEGYKLLMKQFKGVFKDQDNGNRDLVYYRILSRIQNTNSEIRNRWKEEGLSKNCIDSFNAIHMEKMEKWLQKIRVLCYSDEKAGKKEEELMESIVVLLYQTVIDARKGYENSKQVRSI